MILCYFCEMDIEGTSFFAPQPPLPPPNPKKRTSFFESSCGLTIFDNTWIECPFSFPTPCELFISIHCSCTFEMYASYSRDTHLYLHIYIHTHLHIHIYTHILLAWICIGMDSSWFIGTVVFYFVLVDKLWWFYMISTDLCILVNIN